MELNIDQIEAILPHRYPFLLVDKIVECVPGESAKGVKCVTANEPFFQGHFPGFKVMPGVLIIEALAQVGAVAILTEPGSEGKLALFGGIKNARFTRQVRRRAGAGVPPHRPEGAGGLRHGGGPGGRQAGL